MDKLLAPLLTRFSVIRLKSYTQEEFVEIVVKVLNRDEGIEKYMIWTWHLIYFNFKVLLSAHRRGSSFFFPSVCIIIAIAIQFFIFWHMIANVSFPQLLAFKIFPVSVVIRPMLLQTDTLSSFNNSFLIVAFSGIVLINV